MSVWIAEVLDQDGETWIKTDPFRTDIEGYLACVRLTSDRQFLGGERLRAPCGAVIQVRPAWWAYPGAVGLYSPFSSGRPPRLEAGMRLEVVTDTCEGTVASCEGIPSSPEERFWWAWREQQRLWVARHFLSWCNPGRPWP